MFGKKQREDKPAAPKPSSRGSGKAFDPKEFMLLHVEKFLFALIALIAVGLIYLGATKEGFESNKDPEKLSKQSSETIRRIGEDHWEAIKNEDDRVKGITDVVGGYAGKTFDSTKPMLPVAIGIDPGDPNRVRERRIDPDIFPAKNLEAKYFYGPIVDSSSNAQRVAIAEALNKLPDAKVKEEKEKKDPSRGGRGLPPGGRPPGGMPGPGGGMPPGAGGLGQPASPAGSKKYLAAGYDRGFPSHTLAPPSDKKKVLLARDVGFVSVMALAPHQDLEVEYRNKLAKAGSVMPGRDTPYYVGFEVQRADVTDNPSKDLQDADWQALPNAGSEILKERAKSSWLGTNSDVAIPDWTMANLTMPVPPVLLKDYRPFVTHSEIPKLGDLASAASPPGTMGGFGGFGGGGDGSDGAGEEGGPGGMAGLGGPAGFGGAPPGYGGGPGAGGGAPPGYGGGPGGGGPPSGFGGGPGGLGGAPPGYGGGLGGMAGMGGSGTSFIPPTAETPKPLPSTKFKLVRFYDFETKANRIYRYRVRLLMYDPNFPEAASIQPRSSMLDVASGTLKRVQELLEKERSAQEAEKTEKKEEGKTSYKRNSSRPSAWSEPSPPVSTVRTSESYLGEPKMVYSTDKEQKLYEASPPRAEVLVADWDTNSAIFLPRHDLVSRGYVFGLPNREAGKEVPIEIIHPITKVIKSLAEPKIKNLNAVIDLTGFSNLEAKSPKDPYLKSGAKGAVFDPEAGRIIVLREFDDFGGYGMHFAPDKPAVGPLGGPLKLDGGSTSGGMGGLGGPGGGGLGGPGPGGLGGLGGPGSPGGAGAGGEAPGNGNLN
jgi:hypothetical protein